MSIDRRHFLAATTATGAFTATEAIAAPAASSSVPISGLGVDAFHLGVRTSSENDQTEALQRAIVSPRASTEKIAVARAPVTVVPVTSPSIASSTMPLRPGLTISQSRIATLRPAAS